MKKLYSKPVIVFDNFQLSQSIARCEVITNVVKDVCGVYDPEIGLNIFTAEVCDVTSPDGPDIYNGVCYHVPNDNYNLFSS